MGAYDNRPYEVGKGKPPVAGQWKKGKSGNPRGPKRKRKAEDVGKSELLAELMNKREEVTIGTRTVLMSTKELMLRKLIHDALNGTPSQRLKAIDLLGRNGAFDLQPSSTSMDIPMDTVTAVCEQLAREFAYNPSTGAYYDPVDQPGSD